MKHFSVFVFGIVCVSVLSHETSADLVLGLEQGVPRGISADGQIVVGGLSGEAFRWTRENGIQGLGDLDGGIFSSNASAISADGSTIVGVGQSQGGGEAFRWTSSQGMVGLGFLPGANATSRAHATTSNGSIVVGSSRDDGPFEMQGTVWDGSIFGLGDLPGGRQSSEARGISANGEIIVGTSWSNLSSADHPEAFRWTAAGGMVGLGHLPGGGRSVAAAISADGLTIVGESTANPSINDDPIEAYRWTESEGMIGLGYIDGFIRRSSATAVSADGSVIVGDVGFGNDSASRAAFYWTENDGMVLVEDLVTQIGGGTEGWDFHTVTGVSANGRIFVGEGVDPDGRSNGYIVNLDGFQTVPEPSSLLLIAGIAIGCWHSRHRRIC